MRLHSVSYQQLRKQILQRDGWRCQSCGAMSNLEVHHMQYRSHSGEEVEDNLISLCTRCHVRLHRLNTSFFQ
jgi:5-methylcytosine-specific restriction endonuclease McrA